MGYQPLETVLKADIMFRRDMLIEISSPQAQVSLNPADGNAQMEEFRIIIINYKL